MFVELNFLLRDSQENSIRNMFMIYWYAHTWFRYGMIGVGENSLKVTQE